MNNAGLCKHMKEKHICRISSKTDSRIRKERKGRKVPHRLAGRKMGLALLYSHDSTGVFTSPLSSSKAHGFTVKATGLLLNLEDVSIVLRKIMMVEIDTLGEGIFFLGSYS